jgi:hypothetical protein
MVINLQVTPSVFLLAKLRTDLDMVKILGIGTLYKTGSGNFISTKAQF